MQDREDESTVRSHRVADDVEGEVEVVDVGQTEAADDGIERSVAQWCGCDVGVVVADAELLVVRGGDGLLDQCFGQIEALDGGAAAGQLAADATMAQAASSRCSPVTEGGTNWGRLRGQRLSVGHVGKSWVPPVE